MHNLIIVYGMHNSLWNFVLSLLNLTHLTLGRERDIQISSELVVFKLLHFEKPIHEKWKFYKFLVRSIKKLICDSRITNP